MVEDPRVSHPELLAEQSCGCGAWSSASPWAAFPWEWCSGRACSWGSEEKPLPHGDEHVALMMCYRKKKDLGTGKPSS